MTKDEKDIKPENYKLTDCKYYTPDFPIGFDIIRQEKDTRFTHLEKDNRLLFLLEGSISLSFNEYKNCIIKANEMFFLAGTIEFQGIVLSSAKLVIFKNNNVVLPCTDEALRRLFTKKQNIPFEGKGVPMKKEIQVWLDQIIHYCQTGLSCNHIIVIKKQELYMLLKNYLSDEENVQLFYLSLSSNMIFREVIQQNYQQVKTVKELAAVSGHGIKTFQKLFQQNFGLTPHKWMQKQLLFQIKGMLMEKDIPLKQIMFKYKFKSSSYFYHYCRKHFGATPTQIRKGTMLPRNESPHTSK